MSFANPEAIENIETLLHGLKNLTNLSDYARNQALMAVDVSKGTTDKLTLNLLLPDYEHMQKQMRDIHDETQTSSQKAIDCLERSLERLSGTQRLRLVGLKRDLKLSLIELDLAIRQMENRIQEIRDRLAYLDIPWWHRLWRLFNNKVAI